MADLGQSQAFAPRSFTCFAVAIAFAASATAQTTLFSDSFDRPNAIDINASNQGMGGLAAPLWYSDDDKSGVDTLTNIENNQLHLADGPNASAMYLDHNFIESDILAAGGMKVCIDIISNDGTLTDDGRWIGFSLGMGQAEAQLAPLDWDATVNRLAIRGTNQTADNGAGDLSVDWNTADGGKVQVYANGNQIATYLNQSLPAGGATLELRLEVADFVAGSEMVGHVYFDGAYLGTVASTWDYTNANYLGLTARQNDQGFTVDNLVVETYVPTAPTPSHLLVTSNAMDTIQLYNIEQARWTPMGTFIGGDAFGESLRLFAFDQDPVTEDIIVFEARDENHADNRIIRFDKSGWPVEIMGVGGGADFTGTPCFAEVLPNGDLIFTTEQQNSTHPTPAHVVFYDRSADTWIDQFIPNLYDGVHAFTAPRGVTVTPDGRIFVNDRQNNVNSLIEFDAAGNFVAVRRSDPSTQGVQYDELNDRLLISIQSPFDDEILAFPNLGTLEASSFDFNNPEVIYDSSGTVRFGIHSFAMVHDQVAVGRYQNNDLVTITGPDGFESKASIAAPTFIRTANVTTAGRYDLNLNDQATDPDDLLLAFDTLSGPDGDLPDGVNPVDFDKMDADDDGDVDVRDMARYALASAWQIKPPPLHIVVYLSDDHSYFDTSLFGATDIPTPNMDQLANDGMQFTHAFVASPSCAPSRAALLTGLMPARNGAEANHTYPPSGVAVLPPELQKLGYRVVSFGKIAHSDHELRFGFEDQQQGADIPTLRTNVTTFLNSYDASQPLALFVGTSNPHVPWPHDASTFDPNQVLCPPIHINTPDTRYFRAGYYQEIKELDQFLGELRDMVHTKLGDNVLFVHTSDHGGQWAFSKWTLYDYGLRIPFLAAWPGKVPAGTTSDAMISHIDLLPTLIDAAGGEVPDGLDGSSYLDVLTGENQEHRDVIYTTHTGDGEKNIYPIRSVRTREWKLIYNLHPDWAYTTHIDLVRGANADAYWWEWVAAAETSSAAAAVLDRYYQHPQFELYHVSEDPWEQNDLADDPTQARRVADMYAMLQAWMAEQGDTGWVHNDPRPLSDPLSWDPDYYGPDQINYFDD